MRRKISWMDRGKTVYPPPEEQGYNKRKQLPKYLKHIYLADETHRIYM